MKHNGYQVVCESLNEAGAKTLLGKIGRGFKSAARKASRAGWRTYDRPIGDTKSLRTIIDYGTRPHQAMYQSAKAAVIPSKLLGRK